MVVPLNLLCLPAWTTNVFQIQYYQEYGAGTRFVDLGLRTHRIKCRVHDDFKFVSHVIHMYVYALN